MKKKFSTFVTFDMFTVHTLINCYGQMELNETNSIGKKISKASIICPKTSFDLCLIPPRFAMTPHILAHSASSKRTKTIVKSVFL